MEIQYIGINAFLEDYSFFWQIKFNIIIFYNNKLYNKMHPNGSHDLRLRLKIVLTDNFYNCKSVYLLKDNLHFL